ncbi:uncharacterized protein LOC121705763 [Alosa sapidissima]|uniref:uncharacterized protein LOC121705763 n=1 Tax=Alosa sapidissima TaxID=34773 RepID=UPI001C08BB5D|nr:uncharacterized protein LOC121705763 [Alosa sapidissima]XP_041942898.1 uncharacterized protein LOC121705763 [Alosa sapidissima]
MATHKDHGSSKLDKSLEEDEYHRTRKYSGQPESPQSHVPPLSPASLSWEDEAFPISTPNTYSSGETKGSEENVSEEVQSSPGPSTKEGKIPGYGKFAAFLQEEEEHVEDFLDEDDDLFDPEEEEEEVSTPVRRELESNLHTQDTEEDKIPVQNCTVSIPSVVIEAPSISDKQKGEAKNLTGEEDAHISTKEKKAEYCTKANEGASLTFEERLEAISSNEKQPEPIYFYDEKGGSWIAGETQIQASMLSVRDWDQVIEIRSDSKQVHMAHVFTKQHESANTLTQEKERAHTPKDHKAGTDSPSQAVKNTVGPSCEREGSTPKPSEPALTECIQQGESLLLRLHVVQQKQQSPEVSEEFPVMTSQSVRLAGNLETRERGSSVTGPDIDDSCGEESDEDDDGAAGPSHCQRPPAGLETLQAPSEGVLANAADMQLSDGDDHNDSGVSADLSPCDGQEPLANTAASTATALQPAPGTPAQRRRHPSSGHEPEQDDSPKGEETEQTPAQRDPFEGQSSAAAEGGVGVQAEEQGSAGKRLRQQKSSNVKGEEESVRMVKVLGEYIEGSVRKFNERRKLFEAFQQAKPADTKPPPVRPKRILSTSFSAFSLSSVSTRRMPEERIRPSVSVMDRARSLEQLSQAQEVAMPCHRASGRDSDWGNLAESDERDRIIVEGDVTLVRRRRSLRPSYSSEALFGRKGVELAEEGAGEEEEEEDESSVLHMQNPFFQLRPSLALRPDVARDIRDAREREKELRRIRRGLYGSWKGRRGSQGSASSATSQADSGSMTEDYQSRGKLELVWPPPSPTEKVPQLDQAQEPRPLISPSQKALLWQRWQTGTVNGRVEEED